MRYKIFLRGTLFPLALVALAITGCVTPPTEEKKAQAIFNDANYYFAKGKYDVSQKHYQRILDEFPDTPFRTSSLLGSADTYYLLGEYFLSAPLYEQYQDLYPLDDKASHASLYKAMSYYHDIMNIERDQTNTTKALEAFSNFIIKYPKHPAASLAREKVMELDDRLAVKQVEILEFYYKINSFGAVITRADIFLEMYPDTKYVPHVMMLKGKSYQEEEAFKKAEKTFMEIVAKFPDTAEGVEAKEILKTLTNKG